MWLKPDSGNKVKPLAKANGNIKKTISPDYFRCLQATVQQNKFNSALATSKSF